MNKIIYGGLLAMVIMGSHTSSAVELDKSILKNANELESEMTSNNSLKLDESEALWGRDDRRPPPPRYPEPPPRYPGPPRRPEPPPRYPYPPRPVPPPSGQVVCYAENEWRESFWASGYFPRLVQDQAMDLCYRYSRSCYALGCEYRAW